MSYQIKRIDPFWHSHPMIPTGAVIGIVMAAAGLATGRQMIAYIGAAIASVAVIAAAKPVLSALLGSLGIFAGLVRFVFLLDDSTALMPLRWRLVSVLLFAIFYMVLVDAVVLVFCVLYNFFSSVVGLPGIDLDLDTNNEA